MNTSQFATAIYARVSSDRQAREGTIASQIEDLHARARSDGVTPTAELAFVDDGYSGATLIRPALEKLRDTVAAGAIDRLYVHCPDRLAGISPIRSCSSTSSVERASRLFFSTTAWTTRLRENCCCRSKE